MSSAAQVKYEGGGQSPMFCFYNATSQSGRASLVSSVLDQGPAPTFYDFREFSTMRKAGKRVFLITGVSSGFGRAFAEAALVAGNTVIGTVRSESAKAEFESLH